MSKQGRGRSHRSRTGPLAVCGGLEGRKAGVNHAGGARQADAEIRGLLEKRARHHEDALLGEPAGEGEGISANKPSYGGDKIKACISFRTIDAMALASTYGALPAPDRDRMVESVATLVRDGQIYPFAGYELLRLHMLVLPSTQVAQAYARVSSPWELQSAAWALARLAQRGVAG